MWSLMQLAKPSSPATGLGGLSVLKADPYQYGVGEIAGGEQLLSFPNACKHLAGRVDNSKAALAVGFAGLNLADFSQQLGDFSAVLPIPYFAQLGRRASKLLTLETDKFELVSFLSPSLGLNVKGLPGVKDMYKAQLIQDALDGITAHNASPGLAHLADFADEAADFVAARDASLGTVGDALTGAFGWLFYAESNISSGFLVGHPGHEFTHSAVMVFQGTPLELSYLSELFTPL